MKKSTKGVLAASTAGVLLLGGAGSLAYWTADQDIPGGSVTSGTLTLGAPTCTGGWTLDGGDTFTPGTSNLVPGDTITKICDLSLVADGEHIGADLTIDDTALTASALATALDADATFTVDGDPYAPITTAGTYAVQATITVDSPYGGPVTTDPLTGDDNTTKAGSTVLDDISVVAVQTHAP